MNPAPRFERRRRGLGPARSPVVESAHWMTADDGARLATRLLRPADPATRRGAVLIRSERPLGRGSPVERLARWLAEDGRSVALQSCRGRDASEGRFRPFADEVADGGAALRWLTEGAGAAEIGGAAAVVLVGLGYSAFSAWAALAAEPGRVAGLAAGFGARDPRAWLAPGGALQLEAALALAARLDGREGCGPGALDFARAARHRPLAECDRVALRELGAFRDWVARADDEAWWRERTPALPDPLPPLLLVGGWYECALPALWADYARARERAERGGAPLPGLLIGPWADAPLPRAERTRGGDPVSALARAVLRFAARTVGASEARDAPARVFLCGGGWREAPRWPPEPAAPLALHLRSGGRANSLAGDGRLAPEPPCDDPSDAFVADPADPPPARGGPALGRLAGPVDRSPLERRGDVLCFTGEHLARPLELAGEVRLALHAEAPGATGIAAALCAVGGDGASRWLCEGAARVGDAGAPLEIALGPVGARLAAGERLRLALAGGSLPRFARGEAAAAVRCVVHHDARRPSALRVEGARETT